MNLASDVDLKKIGHSSRANGYSGADCAALLREAGLAVLKENVSSAMLDENGECSQLCITERHFNYAFDHVIPSVSKKDQARYNRMRDRMAHARSRGAVVAEPADEPNIAIDEGTVEIAELAAAVGSVNFMRFSNRVGLTLV